MPQSIPALLVALLWIFPIYGQVVTPKERLAQLEKMHQEAQTLLQSFQKLSGEAFTNGYDKYIDILNARIALALKFVEAYQLDSLQQDELLTLLKIAEIAKNDLKQAHIRNHLFDKYSETKNAPGYRQQFFMNAVLMLPDLAEQYMPARENAPLTEFNIYSCFLWFNEEMASLRKKLEALGQPVRHLQTKHWIGAGENTEMRSFRGRVILVNFFRWSCGACNASIPQLQAIQNRFAKDKFVIVGVADYQGQYEHEKSITPTREYELMRDHYRVQRKVGWPLAMIAAVMNNYGIDRTPTYLLVDRNGIAREWDANLGYSYLTKRIKALVEASN